MIRRTPQEIADFFGCYVFQGRARDNFYMTKGKPEWNGADFCLHSDGMLSLIDKAVVDIPTDHDWTHLYEPKMVSAETAHTTDTPHLGEIYTHREYCIIAENKPSELMSKVTEKLDDGWALAGGIAVEHLSSNEGYVQECLLYQAMVRGV